MAAPVCLLDTNVLLRSTKKDSHGHLEVHHAIDSLLARGWRLAYTPQNLAEFWNVCTRPAKHNGFGLSASEADFAATAIELQFVLLYETPEAYATWRESLMRYSIQGTQVHDARLAAVMIAHHITTILTLNVRDFQRYPGITALHPQEVKATA